MKKLIVLPLVLLLFLSSFFPVSAAVSDTDQQVLWEQFNEDKVINLLPPKIQRELAEIGLDSIAPEKMSQVTPDSIFTYIFDIIKEHSGKPLKTTRKVLAAVVLLAFIEGLKTSADRNKGLVQVFEMISVLTVCSSFAKPVISCITSSANAISDCSDFILSFLPVYSGILVAGGQASAASTSHVFLFWLCQITSRIASEFLIPLMGIYLVFCLVNALFPQQNNNGFSSSLKSVIIWSFGLIMTIFVGALTLSSIVSAGADKLSTRTARFLLGSFVPVVGGALSEAFTTAQGCLQLLKSSVGVYAVAASGMIFLPVISQLILWYFSVGISNVASQFFGLSGMHTLLKSMSSSLGILLAMLFSLMLILTVSVTLIMIVGQVVT